MPKVPLLQVWATSGQAHVIRLADFIDTVTIDADLPGQPLFATLNDRGEPAGNLRADDIREVSKVSPHAAAKTLGQAHPESMAVVTVTTSVEVERYGQQVFFRVNDAWVVCCADCAEGRGWPLADCKTLAYFDYDTCVARRYHPTFSAPPTLPCSMSIDLCLWPTR